MNRSHRTAEDRASFRAEAADAMRREPTEAEEAMSALLRDMGVTFREQESIDSAIRGEIVDFWIVGVHWKSGRQMVVEVDGPEHSRNKRGPDARRDRRLAQHHNIDTIRVRNVDILKQPEQVRERLRAAFGWSE